MKTTREPAEHVLRRRDTGQRVPRLLATSAAWSWRMLLVGGVVYGGVWVLSRLALVVLPFIAALLITALLRPVAVLLRRWMPQAAAALLALVFGVIVLGGVGYLIGLRAAAEWPSLVNQFIQTARQLQDLLASSPLNLGDGQLGGQLAQLQGRVVQFLQQNRGQIVNIVSQGAGYAAEFAAGFVLTIFITFFLLHDGEGIWRWLVRAFSGETRARVNRAGQVAWETITGYVHGTAVIATIHGIIIGFVLFMLGVPLVLPLAVLVFLGSFIPLLGALLAGGVAVLIALGTQGWVAGLILLGVLIAENQLEGNLLQPLIMGRLIRLHPLAIGLILTVGTVLVGLVGAIIAVPAAAVAYRVWPALTGRRDEPRGGRDQPPQGREQPAGAEEESRRLAGALALARNRTKPEANGGLVEGGGTIRAAWGMLAVGCSRSSCTLYQRPQEFDCGRFRVPGLSRRRRRPQQPGAHEVWVSRFVPKGSNA